jgi:hypothetical protein
MAAAPAAARFMNSRRGTGIFLSILNQGVNGY